MISPEKIDEIRRLLADGTLSQRQIAALTGISRGTVGAVASGKRSDRLPQPTDDWDMPTGPIVRCASCGGRVIAPCRLCRVRELKSADRDDRRRRAGRDFPTDADRRTHPNPADPRLGGGCRY